MNPARFVVSLLGLSGVPIDVAAFEAWAAWCDARGIKFDPRADTAARPAVEWAQRAAAVGGDAVLLLARSAEGSHRLTVRLPESATQAQVPPAESR